MAEGGQMDSLLDCPICLETLTTPVCLPCGHTFCLQCVTDHAQTFRGYPINEESFDCPACRQTVTIPDGGIRNLPRNYLAEQMKEKSTLTKISCDECREWKQSEAASWRCVECDLHLCWKCKNAHSDDTSITHTIKEIMTMETKINFAKSENIENCNIHPSEVLRFFCETCKVSLCRDCSNDHKGHGRVDIRKAADRARQDITAAMIDKQSEIQKYEVMITELTKTRETITNNTEKEIKKTRERTKLLLDKIRQKSADTEHQIKNTSDVSISTLQKHIDKLLKHVADLQNDVDKCNAAIKFTHYTEILNIGLRIKENTPYRPSQFKEGWLDKPLRYMEFIGKDTYFLNLDKAFKTLEKKVSLCQLELENKLGPHVTHNDLMAPPISQKLRVVTSFDRPNGLSRTVASTSGGQVVWDTQIGLLVFYNKDGFTQTKSLLYKDRSLCKMSGPGSYDIDVADDDSLLIVNNASRNHGGGVYLFNKEGVQTGVIEMDHPHAAAYVADGEVAVLTGSLCDMYLEIWKVTGTRRKAKKNQDRLRILHRCQ